MLLKKGDYMSRPTKYALMKRSQNEIQNKFSSFVNKQVFTIKSLEKILENNKSIWKLGKTTTIDEFIDFLINIKIIQEVFLQFPRKKIYRFILTNENLTNNDLYTVINSLNPPGYFSHYSAVFLNDLTDNIVKTIYYSITTSTIHNPDNRNTILQKNIDYAFSRPARITKNFTYSNNQKIVLLENTFRDEGIKEIDGLHVTNIEKTILDITVRPQYSGGVHEVLKIYKNAKDKLSVNKLQAYLRKANYIYPYHQAIGFYLEKANYDENVLKMLETFPQEYDFYLTNEIKAKKYSKRWKLYYPASLDFI